MDILPVGGGVVFVASSKLGRGVFDVFPAIVISFKLWVQQVVRPGHPADGPLPRPARVAPFGGTGLETLSGKATAGPLRPQQRLGHPAAKRLI